MFKCCVWKSAKREKTSGDDEEEDVYVDDSDEDEEDDSSSEEEEFERLRDEKEGDEDPEELSSEMRDTDEKSNVTTVVEQVNGEGQNDREKTDEEKEEEEIEREMAEKLNYKPVEAKENVLDGIPEKLNFELQSIPEIQAGEEEEEEEEEGEEAKEEDETLNFELRSVTLMRTQTVVEKKVNEELNFQLQTAPEMKPLDPEPPKIDQEAQESLNFEMQRVPDDVQIEEDKINAEIEEEEKLNFELQSASERKDEEENEEEEKLDIENAEMAQQLNFEIPNFPPPDDQGEKSQEMMESLPFEIPNFLAPEEEPGEDFEKLSFDISSFPVPEEYREAVTDDEGFEKLSFEIPDFPPPGNEATELADFPAPEEEEATEVLDLPIPDMEYVQAERVDDVVKCTSPEKFNGVEVETVSEDDILKEEVLIEQLRMEKMEDFKDSRGSSVEQTTDDSIEGNSQEVEPPSPQRKSLSNISYESPTNKTENDEEEEYEHDISANGEGKMYPNNEPSDYNERTNDDAQEDEGDDSVFENSQQELEPNHKQRQVATPFPRWVSQEEEIDNNNSDDFGGMQEPPATPVARDELAMRRHRFFSDLLEATKGTAEHRVRFDPLGPLVHTGCEADDRKEHLEELVNRLESVTKRLERVSTQPQVETQEIAVQTKSPSPKRSNSSSEENPAEESSVSSSSSSRESTVSVVSVVELNMSVQGYEDILAGPLQDYVQLSKKIGGDVANHSKLVEKAFQIQRQYIQLAASRAEPVNQTELVSLLGPTSTQIQEVQRFRDKHRGSEYFNHLSAISESIPALGWVAVSPAPSPYVKEMNDTGQFYSNRVLKEWKEKDQTHAEWCKAWVQTLSDLQQYVRKYHTTGLVWAKGPAVASNIPPPPPPAMLIGEFTPALAENDDRAALFAQINQGENITRNLKKVTFDMQTHKNTNLRTGPAPFKAPTMSNNTTAKTSLPAHAPIDKPPVFSRDGKKWLVEYQKDNRNLVIDGTEMNNVVYIYRCQDSTLTVKGKINSVVMDSCRKSSIVFDSVVSSIEFVNCQSVQMQVLGKVPTISIDKTDGCQMYLSSDSLDVELITSKSSEMNVMVPKGNGDFVEHAVPEQFKTTITPKGLSTVAVDSLG